MLRLICWVVGFVALGVVYADAETCSLTSITGEQCLHVEHYTRPNASGATEHHWRMSNRCDVAIDVTYFQRGSPLTNGETIPAGGQKNATGGGFAVFDEAKEGYYGFHVRDCTPAPNPNRNADAVPAKNPAASPQPGDVPSPAASGAACSAASCMAGCANMTQVLGSMAAQACQSSCTDQAAQCGTTGQQPTYQTAQAVVARHNAPVVRPQIAEREAASPPEPAMPSPPPETSQLASDRGTTLVECRRSSHVNWNICLSADPNAPGRTEDTVQGVAVIVYNQRMYRSVGPENFDQWLP
jgi:hypothetical protein